MKTEYADVAVIGAGLGGLSAAAYLAKAGKRVIVLEHHAVPGGYAHEFRRGKYRIEVSLHALDSMDPGGWTRTIFEDLEVFGQVEFKRLDPFYLAVFPRRQVLGHLDPDQFERELLQQFPHEVDGLHRMLSDMKLVFSEGKTLTDLKLAGGEAGASLGRLPKWAEACSITWSAYMDRFVSDAELKGVLSVLWGYLGVPPSLMMAASYIYLWGAYHLTGAYYPVGGSMAMSRALEKTIRRYGGSIIYRQTARDLEIRDGRAVAVETEQGLRVEARSFVSNASPQSTLLGMVGESHLPAASLRNLSGLRPSLGHLTVSLCLDRDLGIPGDPAAWPHHEAFLGETYDAEVAFGYANSGDWDRTQLSISCYNRADPGCAPPGGSVVTLFSLASWDYADQWGTGGDLTNYRRNPKYIELKNDAANRLIDRAERWIPGLRDSVKFWDVSTPITNRRYTLNDAGAIYGAFGACVLNSGHRTTPATPIPNLMMTGSWVAAGGMSAALISGASASIKVMSLLAEAGLSSVNPEHQQQAQMAPLSGLDLSGFSDDDLAALLASELRESQR